MNFTCVMTAVKLDIRVGRMSSFIRNYLSVLALSYSEHFGAACRAYTLGCWPTVLHSNSFSILHLPLSSALHAVCLHLLTSFLAM